MALPPINPVVEEALRRQEEDDQAREKAAQERRIRQAYVSIFESPDGRVVLGDLRKQFYDVSTHVPGDPYGTHVNDGARDVVLRILAILAEEADRPKEAQKDAEV